MVTLPGQCLMSGPKHPEYEELSLTVLPIQQLKQLSSFSITMNNVLNEIFHLNLCRFIQHNRIRRDENWRNEENKKFKKCWLANLKRRVGNKSVKLT
jgi:hypothetical protein